MCVYSYKYVLVCYICHALLTIGTSIFKAHILYICHVALLLAVKMLLKISFTYDQYSILQELWPI